MDNFKIHVSLSCQIKLKDVINKNWPNIYGLYNKTYAIHQMENKMIFSNPLDDESYLSISFQDQ